MARHNLKTRPTEVPLSEGERPTPERQRKDVIQLVDEADPNGVPVRHSRVTDTIGRLARAGLIEPQWVLSADRFRRDYYAAGFIAMTGGDLTRPRGAGGKAPVNDGVENARERLWRVMQQLGGMSSPAGSVIWHVVGAETSLRQWSLRQIWGGGRALRQEVAMGILIAALGALNGYYTNPRPSARRAAGAVPVLLP